MSVKSITATGRTKVCDVSKGVGFLSVFGTLVETLDFEFSKDGGDGSDDTLFAPLTIDDSGTALTVDAATTRQIVVGKGELWVNASGATSGATVHYENLYRL